MLKNTQLISGASGLPILLKHYLPLKPEGKPVIVFVHGFKGFMDWGHFPMVMQKLVEAGWPVVGFNFSHNGTSPEMPDEFVDLEAFGKNNYSIELDDLGKVIDALPMISDWTNRGVKTNEVYLLGHSRGGGISILKAAEDARVQKVITWAAVSEFGAFFSPDIVDEWQKEGVIYSYNARTEQQMPLYYQLYEDVQVNKDKLNILSAARRLKIPVQVVHGTNDTTVPEMAARQLQAACEDSTLLIVEGANHTFGGKHPWLSAELPIHTEEILLSAIAFLARN